MRYAAIVLGMIGAGLAYLPQPTTLGMGMLVAGLLFLASLGLFLDVLWRPSPKLISWLQERNIKELRYLLGLSLLVFHGAFWFFGSSTAWLRPLGGVCYTAGLFAAALVVFQMYRPQTLRQNS